MRKLKIQLDDGLHEYMIPTSWKEVTLEQILKLDFEVKTLVDHIEILAVFTNLDKSKIENTPSNLWKPLLDVMLWSKRFPRWETLPIPETISVNLKTIEIPKNLELETFGQKVYAAQAMEKNKPDAILDVLACYLQPKIDGKVNLDRVEDVKEEIKYLPAIKLVPIGRFFFRKLILLKKYGKLGLTAFHMMRWIRQYTKLTAVRP